MIKRITNPLEAEVLAKDIRDIFSESDDDNMGHKFLPHNMNSILDFFNDKKTLFWSCFVWANQENNKFDSVIIFLRDKNPKFDEELFSEYLWLSKNPKVGFKLLKTATSFARENGFKYISMSHTEKNPQKNKLARLYNKLGLEKDSTTYIGKL